MNTKINNKKTTKRWRKKRSKQNHDTSYPVQLPEDLSSDGGAAQWRGGLCTIVHFITFHLPVEYYLPSILIIAPRLAS
jgi:hypothetical protein